MQHEQVHCVAVDNFLVRDIETISLIRSFACSVTRWQNRIVCCKLKCILKNLVTLHNTLTHTYYWLLAAGYSSFVATTTTTLLSSCTFRDNNHHRCYWLKTSDVDNTALKVLLSKDNGVEMTMNECMCVYG